MNRLVFFVFRGKDFFAAVCMYLFLGVLGVSQCADANNGGLAVQPELMSAGTAEDRVLWYLRAGLGIKYSLNLGEDGYSKAEFESRLRCDRQSDFISTGKRCEFRVRRAALDFMGERAGVSLGLQTYTWGDSGFFDGVDFVNPRDLTEPAYTDDQQTKIPIPSLNLRYLGDNRIFQLILSLSPERSPIPDFVNGLSVESRSESDFISGSEAGLKAGGLIHGGWDINAYILSHTERMPQFVVVGGPAQVPFLRIYEPRVFTLGLSATQAADDLVFRSEFALHSNRAIPVTGSAQERSAEQFVLRTSVDATLPRDALATFEFWCDRWNARTSEPFQNSSILGGVRLQRGFWEGKFEPSLGLIVDSNASEHWGYVKFRLRAMGTSDVSLEIHRAKTKDGAVLARRGLKNLIRSSMSFEF